MKTNSDAPQKLYLGLDVHKEETVIAILASKLGRSVYHMLKNGTTFDIDQLTGHTRRTPSLS